MGVTSGALRPEENDLNPMIPHTPRALDPMTARLEALA
jgi:hypothetical protein